MNQTHKRGFTKVESAYSFLKNQVEAYSAKQLKIKRQHRTIAKRFGTVLTVIALTFSVNLPELKAEAQDLQVKPVVQSTFDTGIRLDNSNYSLLVIDQPKPEIKPGKSLAQLQAEAARARALAAAQPATTLYSGRSGRVEVTSTNEAHKMAQDAAAKAGIPQYWKVLAALWQVESGKTAYGCIQGQGGYGPMQFNPGTFRGYQADGDGDGKADICNAKDALVAAGNLLKRSNVEQNADQAIFNYNHSMAYVNKVQKIADSIN